MMTQKFQTQEEIVEFFKEVSSNHRFQEVDKAIAMLAKVLE